MSVKTESDFRPLICDDCGKEEGPFYIDTDDNETLCLDCVLALPSEERRDFEEALGKSEYWELHRQRNGKVTLRCVECCEVHGDGPWDEDDDGYAAMEAILSADEPHECVEDEEEGERKVIHEGVEYMVLSQTEDGETTVIAKMAEGFPFLFDPNTARTVRSKDCEWLPNEEE
jgi:hypothetical protein